MQKRNIALAAPFTSYSGYGQYGRSIALMLVDLYKDNKDISIFLFDITGGLLDQSQIYNIQRSKYRQIQKYIIPNDQIQKQFFDLFITVSIPMAFMQRGLVNIGVTALAEVDKVHPQLIQACNKMDQVLIMSQFNQDALKNSMFKLPDNTQIKIASEVGILGVPFISQEDSRPHKTDITTFLDQIPQKFLFLTVGEWLPGSIGNDRKDIGALISTFLRGFANNKDIGLVLKTNQGRSSILSQYGIRERINEIARGLGITITTPNVYFISGNLTNQQMIQIYDNQKIKAYVSFTHGESFNLPILEFSGNTGKPLLIPYHSGMLEYIKPEYCQILIHKQTQVHPELFQTFMREFLIPESKWYTIDYQYALFKMGQLINNYDKIALRSKNQQAYIKQQWSKEKLEMRLRNILDKFLYQDEQIGNNKEEKE